VPTYLHVAHSFADLHDRSGRMLVRVAALEVGFKGGSSLALGLHLIARPSPNQIPRTLDMDLTLAEDAARCCSPHHAALAAASLRCQGGGAQRPDPVLTSPLNSAFFPRALFS
jgi:hypothetical protein